MHMRISLRTLKHTSTVALIALTASSLGCAPEKNPTSHIQGGADTLGSSSSNSGAPPPATGGYCASLSGDIKKLFDVIHHACPHFKDADAQAAADLTSTGVVRRIEVAAHALLHNATALGINKAGLTVLKAIPVAALTFESAKTFCAVAAAGSGAIEMQQANCSEAEAKKFAATNIAQVCARMNSLEGRTMGIPYWCTYNTFGIGLSPGSCAKTIDLPNGGIQVFMGKNLEQEAGFIGSGVTVKIANRRRFSNHPPYLIAVYVDRFKGSFSAKGNTGAWMYPGALEPAPCPR